MKKKSVRLLLLFAVLFSICFSASAQIYVKIRPPVPVIVRPPQPSRGQIWINEEWEPNNGNYRYSGGHWQVPPQRGNVWVPGHWKRNNHKGNLWVPGKWKKRRH
jgi:hypothetical protein